jgi:hypothetical protein
MKQFVSNLLSNIKPLVLISHMDGDHYCALGELFPEGKRQKVIVGGLKVIGKDKRNETTPQELKGDDVQFFGNKVRGEMWIGESESSGMRNEESEEVLFLDDENLRVACFFPQENGVNENGNEQSLMIKVTYAKKNILFPGDCSATLLEKLSQTEGFADFFSNIDVFVFSHHGDGHNGEFSLFGVVSQLLEQPEQQPHVPLCAIVSSNPSGRNHIPKGEIVALGYPRFLGITKWHRISVYDYSTQDVIEVPTLFPTYVTCDAVMAYQLTIPSDGSWADLKNIDFNGNPVKSGFYPP